MSYVIALDLSLSNTGIAIFDDTGNCIKLLSIDTKKEKDHPKKLYLLSKVLKALKKEYKPKTVVIEQGFTRFNLSTQAIFKVMGVANLIFHDIEQILYHSTTVRKEVLGKGNAKKEDLQKFILNTYKNITFEDLDQSDAFGLGVCYFKKKGVL